MSRHDRHFYASSRAFGRFGMRIFEPTIMEKAHWHGHIEANFLMGAQMQYDIDGGFYEVPERQLVLFWAGSPHQLLKITPQGNTKVELANLYIPIDVFLLMPHIAELQGALFGGAMVCLAANMVDETVIRRWYADYRANDYEHLEVVKMEINAQLRRAVLQGLSFIKSPVNEISNNRPLSSSHIMQVMEMVRYIMENLAKPMSNQDIAAVTGLHQNYALTIFSRTMRMPMKQFVIRMKLLRARALLLESAMAIAVVAENSGFSSISQFYHHFKENYGLSPHQMRLHYTQMELR